MSLYICDTRLKREREKKRFKFKIYGKYNNYDNRCDKFAIFLYYHCVHIDNTTENRMLYRFEQLMIFIANCEIKIFKYK